MTVQDTARAFCSARQEFYNAFPAYFDALQPLPDDRFWQLQLVLRREVILFRFGYGRSNGVEQAARELFRKVAADDFGDRGGQTTPRYTLEEALQFARGWREFRGKLYQPLFNVIENRGDDAYGDLLDALPLAGSDVISGSLSGEFPSNKHFEMAVGAACGDCPQLAELILRGENYVGTALFDAARDYFAIAAAADDESSD